MNAFTHPSRCFGGVHLAIPRQFTDCNTNQGISAGWADVSGAGLDCQWIDVTDLPDGDYVLEARTNRNSLLTENLDGDNFTWIGVRITGTRGLGATLGRFLPGLRPELGRGGMTDGDGLAQGLELISPHQLRCLPRPTRSRSSSVPTSGHRRP